MIQWGHEDSKTVATGKFYVTGGTGTIYTSDGVSIGSCTVNDNGWKISTNELSIGYSGGNMRGLYKAYIVTADDEIIEVEPFLSYKDKAETKALLKSGLLTADNADDVDDFTVILQRLGDAPEHDEDDNE